MLGFLQVWFCAFLFAGMFVPEDQVVWPLRIFCSISPLKWALRGMMYIEFSDTTWAGAVECVVGSSLGCTSHQSEPNATGWECPGLDPLLCLGYTGKQVLDSMGKQYESLSSEDTVLVDSLILVGISCFFKICTVVTFFMRTRSFVTPGSPSNTDANSASGSLEGGPKTVV